MKIKVALVKSNNSFEGVSRSLEMIKAEVAERIKDVKKPVIKVNFVTVYNEVAATPVEAVKAIIEFLKPMTEAEMVVAEGATVGSTDEGWRNYGYLDLEKDYGVKLVDLNKDDRVETEIYDGQGHKMTVPYSRTIAESDFLVSVCRPKTHDTVVATLTLKNVAVGGLEVRSGIHQGRYIHPGLMELAKFKKPDLSVLDGIFGMEGNGPVSGTKIDSGWVATGLDFLAVDSLGLDLMGIDIDDVGYLKMCDEEGLGEAWPGGNIELIGEKVADLRKEFKLHQTAEAQKRWR